ncbi:MAG: hypothetical protein AAF483_21375 [Planctomycetota bacterium]
MKLRNFKSHFVVLGIVLSSTLLSKAGAQELTPVVNSTIPPLHFSSRVVSQPSLVQEAAPAAQEAETETAEDADKGDLAPIQTRALTTEVRAVSIAIGAIGTGILPDDSPADQMISQSLLPDGAARGATHKHVFWRPSLVFHHPLYFEQAMLERHGHDRFGYLQPIASGVKFYSTIALYPYLRTLYPPCETRYALGHYRPGTCAPLLKDHVPYDKRAAAVEVISAGSFFWGAPL